MKLELRITIDQQVQIIETLYSPIIPRIGESVTIKETEGIYNILEILHYYDNSNKYTYSVLFVEHIV